MSKYILIINFLFISHKNSTVCTNGNLYIHSPIDGVLGGFYVEGISPYKDLNAKFLKMCA